EDMAQFRLRKRPDLPDSFAFMVRRTETNLVAEVRHPDDPQAEGQLPAVVEAGDRVHLERLWQLLRKSVSPLLDHRTRVTSVHLDAEDVFSGQRVPELISRIVRILSPTVAEVARRSPNPQELSLKIEHDGGRREEIYVKKADLVDKLEALA